MDHEIKSAYARIIEKRRRRRDTIIIFVLACFLVVLAYYMRRLTVFSGAIPLSSNILVFGLINLNIILLTLLVFLLIRNVTKVVFERRHRFTSSSLRTKLVLTLIGFSILPAVIFFTIATNFVTKSINNWFGQQIESSLQEARDVVDTYYKNLGNIGMGFARSLRKQIKEQSLLQNPKQLRKFLKNQLADSNFSVVEVFDVTGKEVATVINENSEFGGLVSENAEILVDSYQGRENIKFLSLESGDVIWSVLPIIDASGRVNGVLAVNYFVPKSLVDKMASIVHGYEDFKTNEVMKQTLKWTFILFMLVITLLVIFSASWLGFQVANTITGPINEVAEAASMIAMGNLDIYITPPQDNELKNLVSSFNKMTKDLKTNREQLSGAYASLEASNIELQQRRKYMEAVLRNVAAGVISLDEEGLISTVNRSAERILRLNAEQVVGKKYKEVLGPNHMIIVRELMQKVNRFGKDSVETEINFNNGESILTLIVNLTVLRDEFENYMGVVVVFEDITEITRVQKLAAWREIARRIAHEIKNPLTPIQLSAQRLKRKYSQYLKDDDSSFDECVDTIARQAEVLKSMVNEFSSFARMPVSRPALNNLNEVVREVISLYRGAHRDVSFVMIEDESLPPFEFDKNQINRVLINLLDNAIYSVNGNGTVTLRTEYIKGDDSILLEVSDNGRGISNEEKSRLFEPYFSTKKTGMGLGLTIVHSIVSEHSGKIKVEDNHPKGARFIITLPRARSVEHGNVIQEGII